MIRQYAPIIKKPKLYWFNLIIKFHIDFTQPSQFQRYQNLCLVYSVPMLVNIVPCFKSTHRTVSSASEC